MGQALRKKGRTFGGRKGDLSVSRKGTRLALH